ncbi:hypothetical protein [Kordia sp.]|uniref:hypothetical protein n=1 Tax=Kordia sp. TaxID=1965332 RepID=UPI0025C4CC68|nr:hypothetical protein [Kordia sp.]MCH2195914.1 hypothetical protein [Kordia sp.]
MHITDILNKKLLQIGASVSLDKDSNEIGEQIAYQTTKNRSMEIIRVNDEKEIWVSFQCGGVFLPSKYFSEIEKVTNTIFEFLELKVPLKDFLNTHIKPPIDISNLKTDAEIIFEICWFNFLQPSAHDATDSPKWLIIREFATTIQSIAKAKKLFPYRSLDRLYFAFDTNNNLDNLPCIWVSSIEKDIPIFTIGYYDGTKLQSGTAEEIQIAFEEIITKSK